MRVGEFSAKFVAVRCEILACERIVFAAEVKGVFTRTPEGELGILPHHAPAVFSLEDAPVRLKTKRGEMAFEVRHGIARVSPEGVLIFADVVEEVGA